MGAGYTIPLSATIEDVDGNPVLAAGTSVTFTAPATGASGTFVNGTDTTNALTNANGVATASVFTANAAAGPYNVTASSTTLTAATFGATNTATAATKLVATAGAGQTTTVATGFTIPLSATVEDASSNPILAASTSVTFTAPATSASGTFLNGTNTTTVLTNANGVATATAFTANGTVGTYVITATSAG